MKPSNIQPGTFSVVLALFCIAFALNAHAFEDDKVQISKQLHAHEHSVVKMLSGFCRGDTAAQESAQAALAASEAYLSVLSFRGDDPRLLGALFDARLAASPANVGGFSSRVFHFRLRQRTGFKLDFNAIIDGESLSDAKAK